MLTMVGKGVKILKCVLVKLIFGEEDTVMILTDLCKVKNKVVGKKQTMDVIMAGKANRVFLANDADKDILDEICKVSKENDVTVIKVESKLRLGRACGIDVSAACAALLK